MALTLLDRIKQSLLPVATNVQNNFKPVGDAAGAVLDVLRGFGNQLTTESNKLSGKTYNPNTRSWEDVGIGNVPDYTPQNRAQSIGAGALPFVQELVAGQGGGINQAVDSLFRTGGQMIKASPVAAQAVGAAEDFLSNGAKKILGRATPVVDDIAKAAPALDDANTIVKDVTETAPKRTADLFKASVDDVVENVAPKPVFNKPTDITNKWISTREGFTNWRAADIKKNPALTAFDNEGIDAIIDLQSGKNSARYADVQKFTDELFELEKKSGVLNPEQYRTNYLPQLWDNAPEEIQQVFKKNVGGEAGFTKARIFEDYKTGIEAGLTPRFSRISDLLESRFKTSQRAMADSQFVDDLISTGNAKTLDKAPNGWETVDLKWNDKPIAVSPEIAKVVKNYTTDGSPLLQKTAEFVSNAKQTLLSAGIPKTGWNFHTGVNIPLRAAAARKNPLGAVVDSVIWNFNPKSAETYIAKTVPKDVTDGLLRAGLTISRNTDDIGTGFKPKATESLISKARNVFDKLFSEAAFDKILPAHKVKVAWETYENALKQGLSKDEALRLGANTSNTVFGGIDPRVLGRSKDFQNVLRTFLLAPDWLESNVRIAGKVGGLLNPKNWAKPEYAPYKSFAVKAAGMYSSFAMLNKATSGKWPWENGVGQEFNLATGTYDERGRERMIPAFGTAFDFARIPLQLVRGIGDADPEQIGRVLRNRLSPPVSAATSLFITGEDYRGREIDTPGEIASQVAQGVGVPSQITNTVGGLTGEQTPEETVAGLLEAPLRYRGGATTPEKRKTAELLKSSGVSNEGVNKALSTTKSVSGFPTGSGESGANVTAPKTKAEKSAFNQAIDKALESGADIPEKALNIKFFDGKTYEGSNAQKEAVLKDAVKTLKDEFLTDEQKSKIIASAKIKQEDLDYYQLASMSEEDKIQGVLDFAGGADHESLVSSLALNKRRVAGAYITTPAVLDRLYDEGYISKADKSLLTAIKYDSVMNKFYMDRDYKGSGEGVTASKIKSYVNSVNSLFKVSIGSGSSSRKTLDLPKAPRAKALSPLTV